MRVIGDWLGCLPELGTKIADPVTLDPSPGDLVPSLCHVSDVTHAIITAIEFNNNNNSHIFVPVAIESAGTWNHQAVELMQELGRRMTAVTGDTKTPGRRLTCSSGCQWLFNGVMRSPSTALSPPSKRRCGLTCLLFNILYPREFSTEGPKK